MKEYINHLDQNSPDLLLYNNSKDLSPLLAQRLRVSLKNINEDQTSYAEIKLYHVNLKQIQGVIDFADSNNIGLVNMFCRFYKSIKIIGIVFFYDWNFEYFFCKLIMYKLC